MFIVGSLNWLVSTATLLPALQTLRRLHNIHDLSNGALVLHALASSLLMPSALPFESCVSISILDGSSTVHMLGNCQGPGHCHMTSPWQHIMSMHIVSQNGVSDTPICQRAVRTHPLLQNHKVTQNKCVTALQLCATKWNGFIHERSRQS